MKISCLYFIIISICCSFFLFQSLEASNTTDQLSLLSFKSSISDDPFQALDSWNDSTHYCQWQGVTCSRRHTNRVIALDLHSRNLTGLISPLLANLSFLQNLNLSSNFLQGTIPQSFSQFSRIRVIDLKGNKLQGEIPSNLSSCLNLKILRLSNNQLIGKIPVELGSLSNLVYLDLGGNSLDSGIPSSLGNVSSLFAIDLSQNNLFGSIPSNFEKLTSLSFLYLYRNSLVGSIPRFDNFSSLMYLDLSYNNLTGSIPPSLGNLSSVIKIVFTMNVLSGPIPSSLGKLPNLNELYLTANSLSGPIPPSLGSLPSLTALGLSHNKLNGEVPPPLYNISTLQSLGLADNQLVGTLPKNIGHTLYRLEGIYLYYNYFHGSLPMSLANASQLADIEMTGNSFSGTIPSNLGNLQNLYWLSLDRNQFEAGDAKGWSFLASLANCSQLQSLSLDYNGLGGVLPKSVANISTNLQWLALGGNQLYGSIPVEIGNLVNLNVLGMDINFLSGRIPTTIGKLHRLQELYLSENQFSGTIPDSLGNLTNLNKLGIGSNTLEGSIPSKLGDCQALRWLNFSYNQLTGTIPKEIVSISSLTEFVDLSHNSFIGPLPSEVGQLRNLVQLYLSANNLSGEIPTSIGECQLLNTLHMDGNHFQGIIPPSMSKLKGIQELDLSHNNLSGPIPKFIENFIFLEYLNLSFNNLEGEVPTKGIFQNLTAISVIGNANLCGGDPKLNLPTCTNTNKEGGGGSRRINEITIITIVSLCSILLICLLGFWYCLHSKKMKHPSSTLIEEGNNLRVSYSDIYKATDEFSPSNLVGMGSFGSVYKGTINLGEEKTVAIKVLNLQQKGAAKSFIAECNALRSIRHRNLVRILTTCSTLDRNGNEFKALIFEYMPNGSLENWLHLREEKLSLEQRLNIAIDVACALDYLHHHGSMPIVHCDLKPNNILLDDDMTAHVGDFGLAKFLTRITDKSTNSSIGVRGTVGYVAPEYGTSNKVSIHGDLYSYGILVLEMFTGVKPTDDALKEGLNLHKFVEMALPTQAMDIVDPYIIVQQDEAKVQECLVSILQIGLSCSKESPKERMQMGEVIRQMEVIRERLMGNGFQEENSKGGQIEEEAPS